ncbi:hypothetical protein KUV75_02250 [Qipengyuania gaetbuli]|uniref:hypothetical protein n=1 Tax=Qipengyuania gaetbuli TaxID=266952 RepID=UPI001C9904EE|nr:hypothetical protein [Qipengyuania gaetbuli]MBY6013724.1 hypothetical protein [Qipengyuania gaetbuli]
MSSVPAKFAEASFPEGRSEPPLPPLPRAVKYWDDFEEKDRILRFDSASKEIILHDDGRIFKYDLAPLSEFQSGVIVLITAHLLQSGDPSSAQAWLSHIFGLMGRATPNFVSFLANKSPQEIQNVWSTIFLPEFSHASEANCLRKILHCFCRERVGNWAPPYHSIVSNLPSPRHDPFAIVRSGECFIPVADQKAIYSFIDETAKSLSSNDSVDLRRLIDATAIILADQHAFRCGTIARIKVADVRVHKGGVVHITAAVIKKQRNSQRIHITRKVRQDWAQIVRSLLELRDMEDTAADPNRKLLGLTPDEVTRCIADRTQSLTGTRWTATDFRHTSAQRQVDMGASADELADFMQHNSVLVGNVYFDQSPNQAKLVNDALAISPVYSVLPEIHRTRIIDKRALMGIPEERQIGGMPHGSPIAGIGACESPQSLCQKNPVLSCYGCRKFLAVSDVKIHQHVVDTLRTVVMDFFMAGLGDERSPAYVQLKRTISIAQAFVEQFKEQPS